MHSSLFYVLNFSTPTSTLAMATNSIFLTLSLFSMLAISARGQLSTTYYATSCPNVESVVQAAMASVVNREIRMGASILRMHFHDCFVNGCDGSILLKDTATFTGEQNVIANKGSIRGYEVIDTIKAKVEAACSATVSCADILALAARDGTVLLGGPTWTVQLGRRDATTTTSGATSSLAAPTDNLNVLISKFAVVGLSARDMTALSGSHTIGQARCTTFRGHIYNDTNIDPTFATKLQANCPFVGNDNNLAPLEVQTPNRFGNDYFKNLVNKQGVLHSDQELFNNNLQDSLVQQYSTNSAAFTSDFAAAMVKMSGISPLTGTNGEVRLNCGQHN